MAVTLFGFGSFYILVRMLTKAEFGAWSLFMAVTTFLEVTRNGLIQNALIKFLSSTKEEEHGELISASFAISGILTLACIVINVGFANYLAVLWDTPELTNMFNLYIVVYIISGVLMQFQFVEQANFRFNGIFYSSFIRYGALFFFVLSAYLLGSDIDLIMLVYVQIAAVVLSVFVSYYYVRPFLKHQFVLRKNRVKDLFNYGKYVFGTSVSSVLFNTIDQMMLGAMVSTAAAGAFNIAIRITNMVEIPTSSVSAIVFPQSAKRIATEGKEAVKYLYEKSVGVILSILFPGLLFAFFFSDLIVDIIAGEKYAETIPILRITIIYCFFIPYGRQFGTILDSIGKPKITFAVVFFSAALNIILNYVLIDRYGLSGAAYGTLFANVVGFAISQYILKRELNISFINTLKHAWSFYFELYARYLKPKAGHG
jgi:O-antigen/teichoic acid export membrane protein